MNEDGNGYLVPYNLIFWDCPTDAKSESGDAASTVALEFVDVVVFIFDQRTHQSWLEVKQAWHELKLRRGEDKNRMPKVLIVANFSDIERNCEFSNEVKRFVTKYKIEGVEYVDGLCARTGNGVLKLKRKIMNMLIGDQGIHKSLETVKIER